jgi:hypothetical protein
MKYFWVGAGIREVLFVSSTVCLYLFFMLIIAHSSPSAPVAIGLGLLAFIAEGVWLFMRWLSPLRGLFGTPDREISLWRALERELSRSMRHGSPLVIVGMRLKRKVSVPNIEALLRYSDIVTYGRGGFVIVLMTETRIDQAKIVIQRFVDRLPVRAIVVADEHALSSRSALVGVGLRHNVQSEHMPTIALVQGLRLGLFRAEARARKDEPAPVYILSANDVLEANATTNQRAMQDFTRRVA